MITAALQHDAGRAGRARTGRTLRLGDPMRYIGARKGDISSLFAAAIAAKSPSARFKEEAGQEVILSSFESTW